VLVSLDAGLVERLDRVAAERKISRSKLIAELAARGLGDPPLGPGARPEARRAIQELRRMFRENPTPGPNSTQIIREMRDARWGS